MRLTTDRIPWLAVLLTLATAVVTLLGPLWSTAEGENPLTRPTGLDVGAVLLLALPTVHVLASLVVALAGRQRPYLGGLALVVMGYSVLTGPPPLPLWFAPALVLTALGYAVPLLRRRGPAGRVVEEGGLAGQRH